MDGSNHTAWLDFRDDRLSSVPGRNLEWRELVKPVDVGDVLRSSDDLERVPTGTVVLDKDGDVWQRLTKKSWYQTNPGFVGSSPTELLEYLPVTVIYIPEEHKGD
jgi:hypothetical protein